jgi:hypothetical protein
VAVVEPFCAGNNPILYGSYPFRLDTNVQRLITRREMGVATALPPMLATAIPMRYIHGRLIPL